MEAADNGRWAIKHRREDEEGWRANTTKLPLRPDKSREIAGVCEEEYIQKQEWKEYTMLCIFLLISVFFFAQRDRDFTWCDV